MITARLTVFCVGRDKTGHDTHDRTVVADLGVDNLVGVVILPTAQQRGAPTAGAPHRFGRNLTCRRCGDSVPVGRGLRRLKRQILDAHAAGAPEVPLWMLKV